MYCSLAIIAALRYLRTDRPRAEAIDTSISILKPLSGLDEGLVENLRSFFEQDYQPFELLFAVRHTCDPAASVVRMLMAEYPAVRAELVVTGEPPYPNAKVFSLKCMLDRARYGLIVMSDSDIRVSTSFCSNIAAEFRDSGLDLVTCPYQAVAGSSFWSRLEAVGMNTDFHAGVFTAAMLEGAKFAVGPTIVARRHLLDALGGIERFKDYLAEDFMLGKIAADQGFGVRLSSQIVQHRIGSEPAAQNFAHRLRWARSTRRSRPAGYIGEFFTQPLPIALAVLLMHPGWWPLVAVTILFRAASAWIISQRLLGAKVPWHLLPAQDLLGFAFWIAGFFGNSVHWRGRRYILNRDGTVVPAA